MARTIYIGTLHEPGLAHEVAFDSYAIGKNVRSDTPNLERIDAAYYSASGELLASETLDHRLTVTPLRSDFDERGYVLMRVRYASMLPINVYGFVVNKASGEGVTYPLSAAIGWPENRVWLNRGIFPTGAPPDGWHHEVFVANPSRWAELKFRVILFSGGRRHSTTRALAPRQSMTIEVEPLARTFGLTETEAVGVVARNKPSVYVLGRNERTGALSFVEHLVTYPRTNFHIPPPAEHDQPDENAGDALDRVFCYCNGMTLRDALAHEREGLVGNYCTGCRDDLRVASQTLKRVDGDEDSLRRRLQALAVDEG